MEIFPEIKNSFYDVLSIRPIANKFIKELEQKSNVLLFGGCIRDYYDNKFRKLPRDFDIVLSSLEQDIDSLLQSYNFTYKRNKFGGYKVKLDDLQFDIWEIHSTWAFKEKKVDYQEILDLNKTVFLNVDSIFYDLNKGLLFDEGYRNAIETKLIDIILTPNPYPELNLTRALRYKYKYNLQFSNQLHDYMHKWLENFGDKENGINHLKEIEVKRYNTSIINWEHELELV